MDTNTHEWKTTPATRSLYSPEGSACRSPAASAASPGIGGIIEGEPRRGGIECLGGFRLGVRTPPVNPSRPIDALFFSESRD